MIAVPRRRLWTVERRAGWFVAAVSTAVLAGLVAVAASWPEQPPSAEAVAADLEQPVTVALAFVQRYHASDPAACLLAMPEFRARLGRGMHCLRTGRRPRPEVRALSDTRSGDSTVAVVEVGRRDAAPLRVTVDVALDDDRWLVRSMTTTHWETP